MESLLKKIVDILRNQQLNFMSILWLKVCLYI